MLIALGTITLCACAGHRIPTIEESEPSGREIYMSYCARCHGEDGKGKPSAAGELAAADLTQLAKRNGGKFPADRLRAIGGGLEDIPAHHGPDPMPIWGDMFRTKKYNYTAQERVNEGLGRLTAYLESIQQQ